MSYADRLASLMTRSGDVRAAGVRDAAQATAYGQQARGAAWGQAVQQLGQIPGQVVQAQQAEQDRARALAAEDRQIAATERLTRQDTAFMALLEQQASPDPKEVMAIYGPQRGMQIAQGLSAFGELQAGQVKDARDTAGRLAIGIKSLSPAAQQQFWPAVREAAIKGGLGDATTIPEQASPEYLDAVLGWATGKGPEAPPSLMQVDPTKDLAHPQTGEVVRAGVPAVEKPKQYQVTTRGPNGQPVNKLVSEDELRGGVPEYRAPQGDGSEPLMAIMGPDGQPVYVPRSQAVGKRPASNREQGRPVTSGDADQLAELATSLDDLKTLRGTVTDAPGATGTRAKVSSMAPNWVTEWTGIGATAKSKQAVIDRVKQVIGKALEDGVLRKEDEKKYEKILPILSDVASVVETKLVGLEKAIALRRDRQLEALADAGYDTSKFLQRGAATAPQGKQKIGRFEVEVSP